MSNTLNTILTLKDEFTKPLEEAQKKTLIFQNRLKSCQTATTGIERTLHKIFHMNI